MNSIRDIDGVIAALASNQGQLIGLEETSWLDFKAEPHGLDQPKHAVELAKDVSAFANAGGGVLVYGIKTKKNLADSVERSDRLRPIPDGLVNPERIQKKVHELVYPHLDLEIRRFPSGDEGKALWAIRVPSNLAREQPFLTVREISESDSTELKHVYAVYRRVGTMCVSFPQSQVHSWIRSAWFPRNQGLEKDWSKKAVVGADDQLAKELADSGIESNEGVFALQLRIDPATIVPSFFEGAKDSLEAALRDLPYFRYAGFNFGHHRSPERTSRNCLRLSDDGSSVLSITETGLLTSIQRNGRLTWAWQNVNSDPQNGLAINSVALVEFTLESCRLFVDQILSRLKASPTIFWRVKMLGLLEPYSLVLYKGQPGSYRGPAKSSVSGDTWESDWHCAESLDSSNLSFEVLSEVYRRFGWDPSVIPFHRNGEIVAGHLPS